MQNILDMNCELCKNEKFNEIFFSIKCKKLFFNGGIKSNLWKMRDGVKYQL